MRIFSGSDRLLTTARSIVPIETTGVFMVDGDYCEFIAAIEFLTHYLKSNSEQITFKGNDYIKEPLSKLFPGHFSDEGSININFGKYDPKLPVPCLQSVKITDSPTIRESIYLTPVYDIPYSQRIFVVEVTDQKSKLSLSEFRLSLLYHDRIIRGQGDFSVRWRSEKTNGTLNYDESAEHFIVTQFLDKYGINLSVENVEQAIIGIRVVVNIAPVSIQYALRENVITYPVRGRTGKTLDQIQEDIFFVFIRSFVSVFNDGIDPGLFVKDFVSSPDKLKLIESSFPRKDVKDTFFSRVLINRIDTNNEFNRPTMKIYGPPDMRQQIRKAYNAKNLSDENLDGPFDIVVSVYPEEDGFTSNLKVYLSSLRLGGLLVIITQKENDGPNNGGIGTFISYAINGKAVRPVSLNTINASTEEIKFEGDHFYLVNLSSGILLGQIVSVLSKTLQ